MINNRAVEDELHILLIDDDPMINFLNKIIIEKSNIGAKISEITQAEHALKEISVGNLNPSLILLDLNMPVMDGWEFVEQFEKLSNRSLGAKIIILSSSINPSDKEKASSLSTISDFYSKPLSLEMIKEIKDRFVN
ncbi:response regulator [Ekhidna sp.]|uniref:response regulator n=1 Tax=Ekhidna sp. TaxID=2608089 RepID=UPI003297102E